MKDQLYLMRPGFTNAGLGPFYCGDSVSVEGMLSFFPELRDRIDVHYIAFPRPRQPLIDALGDQYQSIPVLILDDETVAVDTMAEPRKAGGHRFYDDEKKIRQFLSARFGLPEAG
jgi:hypothetical protein